jgi:hypothetical protein
MFTLTATTNKSEGCINVPVLRTMTNEDVAEGIFKGFNRDNGMKIAKHIKELENYVRTLRNYPDEVFINPYNDVCEDSFILSFDFI